MDPAVRWGSATVSTTELVRDHALAVLGPGRLDVGHLCPRCGSSGHGQPWARHVAAADRGLGREVYVSVSRAAGYAVTALSLRGKLGVDVEVVADVARRWEPSLVLAPGEHAGTSAERARCWAAKEAVLKRAGTGLATPMTQVRLIDEGELVALPAPAGLVAVLAPPVR